MSALIRRRSLYGGLIMSASHNPGGPGESSGAALRSASVGHSCSASAAGVGAALPAPSEGALLPCPHLLPAPALAVCRLHMRAPAGPPPLPPCPQRRTGALSSTTRAASPPLRRSPTRSTASPSPSQSSRWGPGPGARRRLHRNSSFEPESPPWSVPLPLLRTLPCCRVAPAHLHTRPARPWPPPPPAPDGRHPGCGPVQGRHHQVWLL